MAEEKKATNDSTPNAAPDSANQMWSVILFTAGVFATLLIFMKGSDGWKTVHRGLLGMFGFAVFTVPVLLFYLSVQIGKRNDKAMISKRVRIGIALTIFIATVIQVMFSPGIAEAETLKDALSIAKANGEHLKGGGVFGSLIGYFMLNKIGVAGSRIITLLILFVLGMGVSGKGVLDIFNGAKKAGDRLKDSGYTIPSIQNIGNGIQNLIMGNEFNDEFIPDDDYDDDDEQKSRIRRIVSKRKNERGISLNKEPVEDSLDIPIGDEGLSLQPADDDFEIFPADTQKMVEETADISSFAPPDPELMKAQPVTIEENDVPEIETELNKSNYTLPPLTLLAKSEVKVNRTEVRIQNEEKGKQIVQTLNAFGVDVTVEDALRGPSITRFEVKPQAGVKVRKITGLSDDLALSLAAQGVRIAPVPGKSVIGIEIPNETKDMVSLREILSDDEFQNSKSKLAFAVGKDITGKAKIGDIAKMPHVIIAGTTGSGKSVCTRSIIMSILFNAHPDEVKLILIDPKIVEFKVFEGIPHLLIPIVTDVKKAAGALGWAVNEMMRRYNIFADVGANDLKSYNELAQMDEDIDKMPQIVVFIDELADMMLVAKNEVEDSIQRLAQMGRAAGMHLVVATQRPTTDVITGIIKANIPSRIALSVKSQVDSRTIIDCAGAEKLLGNGDMLYMPIGASDPVRVQGCFASNKDISATLSFIKAQFEEVTYDNSIIEAVESFVPVSKGDHGDSSYDSGVVEGSDEDYVERAIKVAVDAGQLSTSMLQRKLKLGYARAARIMDELEERGVIAPSEGAKPRRVLMSRMQYDERRTRMEME